MDEDDFKEETILVCGDFHDPTRCNGIPKKFKEIFEKAPKITRVVCTGNIGNLKTYEWLRQLGDQFYLAKGDSENPFCMDAKESLSFKLGQFTFGAIHGHQVPFTIQLLICQVIPWDDEEALMVTAKELSSDILIYGNSHEFRLSKYQDKYFLNPGSISGSYGPLTQKRAIPSFSVLKMEQEDEIQVYNYLYNVKTKEVKIQKTVIAKEEIEE